MIGRGIDQVLPDPCPPLLHEPHITDARDYVALAEGVCGPISRPVSLAYPWGDALGEIDAVQPDAVIVNLETALTRSEGAWPAKRIHYRASPENARMLRTGRVDCCTLANNHVLDWGHAGLEDTLRTVQSMGLLHAGAGVDASRAQAPAEIAVGNGARVLVFSFATTSSGVPEDWAASNRRPGVALLTDLSDQTCARILERVRSHKRSGDVVIASMHWGGNWGFEVSERQRTFARGLVETGDVDAVHGHSSHHPKGIEVHKGRPIIYGCGDLLNDYEGIGGYEAFRADLGLLYFMTLDRFGAGLVQLLMTPTRVSRLQVRRAGADDASWLADMLGREGRRFGTSAVSAEGGRLELRWRADLPPASYR